MYRFIVCILLSCLCFSSSSSSGLLSSSSASKQNNNNNERRLQYGDGNRFRSDFTFFLSGQPGNNVEADVRSFLCQMNLFLYTNVTPTIQGTSSDCLFTIQAVDGNFVQSNGAAFSAPSVTVRFFVNATTTNETLSGQPLISREDAEFGLNTFYNTNFNFDAFMEQYANPIGGFFDIYSSYSFNSSFLPVEPGINDLECPDLPFDCETEEEEVNTATATTGWTTGTTDEETTGTDEEVEAGDDEQGDEGEEATEGEEETTEETEEEGEGEEGEGAEGEEEAEGEEAEGAEGEEEAEEEGEEEEVEEEGTEPPPSDTESSGFYCGNNNNNNILLLGIMLACLCWF